MKKNPIILLKCDSKIMNVLKRIRRELDQHFKLSNFLKMPKNIKSNQIKSHCRCGPAASFQCPGDDLTKPEYQCEYTTTF